MKTDVNGDIVIDAKRQPRGVAIPLLCALIAERIENHWVDGFSPVRPELVVAAIEAYERGELPRSVKGGQ